MCGITAIAGKSLTLSRYNTTAMLESLSRRGPDGAGEKIFNSCWLGHRRLSIIDLASGTQPMLDNNFAITFNGEIYNYRELRAELEQKGYTFKTNSDTEVILKCFAEYGENTPKYLDGMFAFAIWDETKKTLFMARDRFGKKPLYYSFDGENILIASEIKALLASGVVENYLNREALDNYLYLMYIPAWKSIYRDIFQLPAAHTATFRNGTLETKRYWRLEYKPLDLSYEEAKKEVSRLLTNAVKKRMLAADVEVGTLLSGGVDSSFISILAKQYLNHPLKTFALGYGDYINELPFAEQVSKVIQSEHFTLQAHSDLVQELESVIEYFDEPHADTSDFPQHLISKLAARKVKVALSGDGGDEIFMGYGWHTRHHHLSYRSHTLEKLFLNPFQGRIKAGQIFSRPERMVLWGSPFTTNRSIFLTDAYTEGMTALQRITIFDLTTYMPGQLLSKLDRTSMMHGLEMRSPFLDTELVEFVTNLPDEFKATKDGSKIILKDLLSEYMPRDFVYRRKQGFGAPVFKWLQAESMKQYVLEKLGPQARIRELFSSTAINILLKRFYTKKDARLAMRLWVLLCLEIWLQKANPKI